MTAILILRVDFHYSKHWCQTGEAGHLRLQYWWQGGGYHGSQILGRTHRKPATFLFESTGRKFIIAFHCPSLRVRQVYEEITRRVNSFFSGGIFNPNHFAIQFEGNKYLLIKTWNEILSLIKHNLIQQNEQALISDIDQIIGLCDMIDSNAFLPIVSEDLAPIHAKRINSYYDLVDKVVDELRNRGVADTKDFRASAVKYTYIRYFRSGIFGVSLNLKFELWSSCADTPFWINFKIINEEKKWVMTEGLWKACKNASSLLKHATHEPYFGEFLFALFPKLQETEDVVIRDLADQVGVLERELRQYIQI